MRFFERTEGSALAEWMRVSASGYPVMLTLHAIGLAVMVGVSVLLSLRMLGLLDKLPIDSLKGYFKWAWLGFVINAISGTALWTMQAVLYMHTTVFLIKITGVLVGAALVAVLQHQLARAGAAWNGSVPLGVKGVAALTLVVWSVAMAAGRLIAYLS